MFVYIDDSIANALSSVENKDEKFSIIETLRNLCYSFTKQYHIIEAELSCLEKLKNEESLGECRHLFQKLLDMYPFLPSSKGNVERKIILYYKTVIVSQKDEDFLFDCSEKSFEFKTSKLISENLDDCEFYLSLSRFIHKNPQIYISLENVSCGGSSAEPTMENEINNNYFSLTIMDSDKKESKGAEGESLKSARRVIKKYHNEKAIVIDLLGLEHREKENLLPPSLYLDVYDKGVNDNRKNILFELSKIENNENFVEFLMFLDLKDGTKVKEYIEYIDKKSDYKKAFNIFAMFINNDVIDRYKCATDDNKKNFGDERIFTGVSRMFKKCSKRLFEYVDKPDKCNEILKNIPNHIKDEWRRIYLKVLTFGSALPDKLIKEYKTYY